MKLKLHTRAAGPNFNRAPGFVFEARDDEAKEMIDGGYASKADADDIKAHKERQAKAKAK